MQQKKATSSSSAHSSNVQSSHISSRLGEMESELNPGASLNGKTLLMVSMKWQLEDACIPW